MNNSPSLPLLLVGKPHYWDVWSPDSGSSECTAGINARARRGMRDTRAERDKGEGDLEKLQLWGRTEGATWDITRGQRYRQARVWEKDVNTPRGPMRDTCLCTPGCQSHRSLLPPLLAQHPKQESCCDLAQILHQTEEELLFNSLLQRANCVRESACVCLGGRSS